MSSIQSLFDDCAVDYDKTFSRTFLGGYYRSRTHRVFDKYYSGDSRILELNSGTGEDAIYLAESGSQVLATDLSASMLNVINDKVARKELEGKVSTRILDLQDLDQMAGSKFDGVVSNFGGLNCINNWRKFARDAYNLMNDGGILFVCIMGPIVPWEWLWYLLQRDLAEAFRRVKGKSSWRGEDIYYPKASEFKKIVEAESFQLVYQEALGTFMPPPYTNKHVEKWPVFYRSMSKLETFVCQSNIACHLSDHYVLVFKKC
ncbi:class I SAM-dependent methyltransferase [Aliikangiella coralliicola]|nr:class I SAM-dependent methyltransferase [Aliikangiella coralliicola]